MWARRRHCVSSSAPLSRLLNRLTVETLTDWTPQGVVRGIRSPLAHIFVFGLVESSSSTDDAPHRESTSSCPRHRPSSRRASPNNREELSRPGGDGLGGAVKDGAGARRTRELGRS